MLSSCGKIRKFFQIHCHYLSCGTTCAPVAHRRRHITRVERLRRTVLRVLIVDDSTAMRMMIRKTLKDAGYGGHDYTEAADGTDTLEIVRETPPNLVLSDWNMPTMNGIDLLKHIQAEEIPPNSDSLPPRAPLPCASRPMTRRSFRNHEAVHRRVLQSALDPILG